MKNNRKNLQHLKWMFIFIIFWIVVLLTWGFLFSFVKLSFGIILILFGILGTFLNKNLYGWMVKLNVWGYEKMGAQEIGNAVKSDFYRIFYRIVTFFVGLLALYIGLSEILHYFGINWKFLF